MRSPLSRLAERRAGAEAVAVGDSGEVVEHGRPGERGVLGDLGDVAGEQAVHGGDGCLTAGGGPEGFDLDELALDLGDEGAGDDVSGFGGTWVAGELEGGSGKRPVGGVADRIGLGDEFRLAETGRRGGRG